ncbi:cell division protein FtsZ [Spiroplasma litorale]|uniref:Cell division protein FtsZ n=1 Tax=Spiroplasma litorale TaxID=216942 RepID=A0A0K1W142_9MOLU|nr:cell division protein FtsZ [Spiroplasma litorale]AKX33906.1 cell division protein FtsZ [Spiroplasma litorale]
MALNMDFKQTARIKVIGVGGGGCNAVNRMVEDNVQGVDFFIANTDAQVLSASIVPNKIILGKEISKGLGAGANPDVGKQAAIESAEEIRKALTGADLIFIAAGMGGGTGTGAAPEIAKIAMESGALVIAIVTKPFRFEGKLRNSFAVKGIDELRKYVDSIITISNDRLLDIIGGIPVKDSFREADNILKQGVQTITDLIAVPAVINLDFADVRTVMKGKGNSLFGIGIGSGEDKAIEAANKAITSSLLETSIRGAKDAIINVTGGKNVSLNDAYDAVDIVQQASGEDVNFIFGIAINEHLGDELIVTVIATGFDEGYEPIEAPRSAPKTSSRQSSPNVSSKQKQRPPVREKYEEEYADDTAEELETVYDQRTSFINSGDKRPEFVKRAEEDRNKINNRMERWKENRVDNGQEQKQVAQKIEDTDDDDGDFPTFLRKKW